MKLELTKAEVDAVIDYIWQHTRGSKKGRAFKVWEKMFKFQLDAQNELFEKRPAAMSGSTIR